MSLELLSPEVLYDILISYQGILYLVVSPQPCGDTAAGAAITDGIEVLLTPHNSMNHVFLVALAQDVFRLLL